MLEQLAFNTAGSIIGYFTPTLDEPIDITNAFVTQNAVFTDLGTPDPLQIRADRFSGHCGLTLVAPVEAFR
jgi:probable HAF family extracellular repeat protein